MSTTTIIRLRVRHRALLHAISHRLAQQHGFVLIHPLLVLLIVGGLLAIAVPSYRGYKEDHANQTAAQSSVRKAVPAVEAFYADNGTYVGMTLVALTLHGAGNVSLTAAPTDLSTTTYCIKSTVGNKSAWKANPTGAVVTSKPAGCSES